MRDGMGLFYTINIDNNVAMVISIKEKKNSYTILKSQLFDTSELKNYLSGKKYFYLSADQDDVIDEQISVPSLIKNDQVIRKTILHKLDSKLSKNKILFNYDELAMDQHDKTTTYQVDGVYEKEYQKIFHLIEDKSEIKSATASRYSLFALSQQCISLKNYLCVHTHHNKIMILAVHENRLIFSRTSTIIVNKAENSQALMIDEITRSIAYMKQQFKDVEFSTISLSGSISTENIVCEQLSTLTQIPISVLYPDSFMHGLKNGEIQQYILALGNYFLPKKYIFIPSFVIGARQYSLSLKIVLALSLLLLSVISYFTYKQYGEFSNEADQYNSIKGRLIKLVRNTDTYSENELKKSLALIQISSTYLQFHPSDMFILLKPLIDLQKPDSLHWNNNNNSPKLEVTFSKSFKTLEELHQFKESFNIKFDEVNVTLPLTYTDNTNYNTIQFKAILTTQQINKSMQTNTPRQRR